MRLSRRRFLARTLAGTLGNLASPCLVQRLCADETAASFDGTCLSIPA